MVPLGDADDLGDGGFESFAAWRRCRPVSMAEGGAVAGGKALAKPTMDGSSMPSTRTRSIARVTLLGEQMPQAVSQLIRERPVLPNEALEEIIEVAG